MKKRERAGNPSLSAREGECVLVVDDESRVRDLLQITLSGRGFDVLTAASATEGRERLAERRPDVAVIDARLPDREGLALLEDIHARPGWERLPVILISSDTSSEAKLDGFRRGADDYVVKPFSPRELILRIRRILDRIDESSELSRRVRRLEAQLVRGERELDESRARVRGRLFRVGSVISALQEVGESRNRDELLSRFVTIAAGYLELGVCGLFLPDGDTDRLTLRGLRGVRSRPGTTIEFDRSSGLGRVLDAADGAIALAGLHSRPALELEIAPIAAVGISRLFPVHANGQLSGAIAWDGGGGDDKLDPTLIEAVARSVAIALANQSAVVAIQRSFLDTAAMLIRGLESRHSGMDGHSERVAALAVRLARHRGLTPSEIENVRLGAQLHDLGLVECYEELDRDVRPLEPTAVRAIREAPTRAAAAIAEQGPLAEVAGMVRHHHERWDGHGYPDGLGGDSIPIGARIVSLANAFDALLHERPYRPAFSAAEAVEILRQEAGTALDPGLVESMLEMIELEGLPGH